MKGPTMKLNRKKKAFFSWGLSFFCSVLAILFCTSASLAAHHKEEQTTASDVKKEVRETFTVMKNYTLDQQDEAMAAAEEKIEKLDARISEMQESLDNKWQDMSRATQVKTRQTLRTLRQNRQNLAEWYGGMRHSSRDAWEEVKKGFVDSYVRLERAFTQANKEFDKDKDKDKDK
jgi:TolA-binding protein